jgi:hypothetical protein
MTEFPSLKDELRPRTKLKKHDDSPLTDEAIDANSRQIGQKWGATTTPPVPEPEAAPVARVVSIRGYIPHYLDDELTIRAATQRVTKTFLILDALKKAGYHVEESDLIQDRRRNKG